MGETCKAAVGSRKEDGTTGLNQNGCIRIKSGSLGEENREGKQLQRSVESNRTENSIKCLELDSFCLTRQGRRT